MTVYLPLSSRSHAAEREIKKKIKNHKKKLYGKKKKPLQNDDSGVRNGFRARTSF